ncbi:MAG: DUF1501 domain-containing protein [Planctomycetes bacterium]|nr:DUF1501 domain-containing protein [Planctomycetota bacterium]
MFQSHMSRRIALQAGSIGMLGVGLGDVLAARQRATAAERKIPPKSVLFVFLTGGLSHQDSFDMKPNAPDSVRGEFAPINTQTPGIFVCEHLPRLAAMSSRYALVRSIATQSSAHGDACHMLLTGRLDFPAGYNEAKAPSPNEWPSLLSQVTYAARSGQDLPTAVVLPQPSVNEINKVRPGQYAGKMGAKYEAWHVDIAAPCALGNGACPNCFRHDDDQYEHGSTTVFETPMLTLPAGGSLRLNDRARLLAEVERQQLRLERSADALRLDEHRRQALSVLADPQTRRAFDVEQADAATLGRYGKNKFGLSLLMARRLIAAGVSLVQVNLGKNSSWDTHRRNFINLKQNLLPYFDQSIAALLDDLHESGLLETTLVIVMGEFGRTPKINKDAGRDHWAPANTALIAGAGTRGGSVIGATDELAAYVTENQQTPENVAATIFQTLGIPRETQWVDFDGRPYELYRGEPIVLT